jgi:hypothetical protein
LVEILFEDAADLIEALDLGRTMDDLALRTDHPCECSAAGRLTRGILDEAGVRSPMDLDAEEFNRAAETYYRNLLRRRHLDEAFRFLSRDAREMELGRLRDEDVAGALRVILPDQRPSEFVAAVKHEVMEEEVSIDELVRLINFVVTSLAHDIRQAEAALDEAAADDEQRTALSTSICGAA